MSMKKKTILIVEPDAKASQQLEELLKRAEFETFLATDGASALKLLETRMIDGVISEISLSDMKGLELTRTLKQLKPIPVILMTLSSDLNETLAAYEAGVDGFIAKPVRKEEVIEVVVSCLGLDNENDPTLPRSDEFARITVNDFVVGTQIKYDVYIKLTGQKYVKIAHRGEDLSAERVDSYKARDVQFLYLLKSDFKKYVGHAVTASIGKLAQAQGLDPVARTGFIKHTGEIILQNLFSDDVNDESYSFAKVYVENAVSALTEEVDAFKLLTVLNSHADFVYVHSVAVSFYGTLIARQVKWTSPPNLFKVAMGGLLHDIGMKEIDRAILLKPRAELNAEESRLLDSHTLRGRDILSRMPTIPTDIIQIVMHHHEDCSGHGFPFGLKKERIHPLARLISVVDIFCDLALKSPNSEGLPPKAALERMQLTHKDSLDPVFLTALMEIFGMAEARVPWSGIRVKKIA